MGNRYQPEAIEKCRKYFVEFGGNPDLIQTAMRRDYPKWHKNLLLDKGKSKGDTNARLGWINRYGFERSAALDLETKIASVESDDERRYRAVVKLADHYQEMSLQGDEKAVDKFIKLTQQQIELRSKLDLSTATFETFAEDFTLIVGWAKEIDAELAKLFYKRKDEFIERARNHFGEKQAGDN